MSFRAKLQASFFALGALAIAMTAWQATGGATAALRRSTYDHLTAVRETKRRLVEDYFADLTRHVLALSADESGVAAFEAFRAAWDTVPAIDANDPRFETLARHYRATFAPRVASQLTPAEVARDWLPDDARARGLQQLLIVDNPHPVGSKDLLLTPEGETGYGAVHAKYHPTLQRYQGVFGFYDVFLIDARDGRVLYSVFKEIDVGRRLTTPPFAKTGLARAYQRAMALDEPATAVVEDYSPYPASYFAPAAFAAAPIWRAGEKIGVLAIQVSISRVNRVMTSDRNWANEGLGRTGHTYIVAADGTLRSDVRAEIEDSESFLAEIGAHGVSTETLSQIRRNGTAVLNLALPERVAQQLRSTSSETAIGTDLRNAEVIRSHSRLQLPGLDWFLIAEMETSEAFAPASALLRRLLIVGSVVTLAFLAAAWLIARSVTRPVMALAYGTRALSARDFHVRLNVPSNDEIGQLASSFNAMAERLEQTTVSRDELDRANQQLTAQQAELQTLNARLIGAQEDERRRLARELHDDLSQRLAAVAIAIGAMRDDPRAGDTAALQDVHVRLSQIAKDVHGLSRRLHPAMLDDLGLIAAVEGECRAFFERGGAPVEFTHQGAFAQVGSEIQLAAYRVVQEALRNVSTHAEATEVQVHLEATADTVVVEIRDNGRGYDRQSAAWRPGLGLASMSERARLLGGSATISSRVGEGTTVHVRLPLEGNA